MDREVGLLLLPVRLAWGERLFVLWAGLKGAVPILLGSFLLTAGVPDASRLYAIVVVVVAFSSARFFNSMTASIPPTSAPWAAERRGSLVGTSLTGTVTEAVRPDPDPLPDELSRASMPCRAVISAANARTCSVFGL